MKATIFHENLIVEILELILKKKLKKKNSDRRAKAEARAGGSGAGARGQGGLPTNMNDPAAMQAYFLQEVQLGEELMTNGMIFFLKLDKFQRIRYIKKNKIFIRMIDC